MKLVLIFSLISLVSCQSANKKQGGEPRDPAIYDEDNRKDYFEAQVSPAIKVASRSVFAMIYSRDINPLSTSNQDLPATVTAATLGSKQSLCASETFAKQPSAAMCTGFLVAPNIMATAGHCIKTQSDCDGIRFVADFRYESPSSNPLETSTGRVFACKKILRRVQDGLGADYGLIELTQSVTGRTPLKLSSNQDLRVNSSLTLIGFPSGLPMKIADGAEVLRINADTHFVSNVDAFGGNSGSPIFNSAGEVEGILVRGAADYIPRGSCQIANRCTFLTCKGEDGTKSSLVAKALAEVQKAPFNSTQDPILNNQEPPISLVNSGREFSRFVFQQLNTRLRNCRVNLGFDGIKKVSDGIWSIDLEVTSTQTNASDQLKENFSTKNWSTSLSQLLSSITRSTITRCLAAEP